MKGIIILAVSSFLVGVQASRIPTVPKELEDIIVDEPWMLEEKEVGSELNNDVVEVTSAINAVDEIQTNKTIPELCFFIQKNKDGMDCIDDTCQWWIWLGKKKDHTLWLKDVLRKIPFSANDFTIQTTLIYYQVSYLPWRGQFILSITYRENYSCTIVPAEQVKYCLPRPNNFVCIELKNTKQDDGGIYTDVTLSKGVLKKTFYNIYFHF